MATDVATLSLKVVHDDVDRASKSLDKLSASSAKAETSTKGIGRDAARSLALASTETKTLSTGLEAATGNALALKAAVAGIALAGAAIAGAIFHKIVEESKESQAAVAQLNATLKSTGGVAGLTSAELQEMAGHIQDVSTFGDDAATKMHSLLLTFTNVRGDVFRDASSAVVDLATKMDGDLSGAAIQVGKALNDPIKGVSALTKVGVSFTEQQKEQIKTMVEAGRTADAQRIILAELRTEFGGSAEAARNTLGGALDHLSNAWGDLFEVSGKSSAGVVVAINAIADAIPHVRKVIEDFVTNTVVGANNIYYSFLKLHNILSFDLTKSWGDQARAIGAANRALEEERRAANAMARSTVEDTDAIGANTRAKGEAAAISEELAKKLRKEREEREKAAIAANAVNAAEVRRARQAFENVGLEPLQKERKKVSDDATNELAEVEAERLQRNVGATKDAIKATNDWADARKRAIENARVWNDATAVATDRIERQKDAEEKATKAAERRIRDVSKKAGDIAFQTLEDIGQGRNPVVAWLNAAKSAANRFFADIIGNAVGGVFAKAIGRNMDGSAAKQLAAGATMDAAANKMLTAAQIFAGAPVTNPTGTGAGPAPAGTTAQKAPEMNPALVKALGYAGIALTAGQTGFGLGQSLYSTSHGAAGNYARGAGAGALSGAAAGAAIGSVVPGVGTAVGAVVGGIVGFTAGILGVGKASKDAKRQLEELQKSLAEDMASLRATVARDSLASAKAAAEADRERRRKAIEEAYQGGGANSDTVRKRNQLLAEMNRLEDAYIAQLEEEARVKSERTIEDFNARADAATPGNEAAEAEAAFLRGQRREREDLVASFGPEIDARERATLAALDNAQAAELAAARAKGFGDAVADATASFRNAPTGFWADPYIRQFAQREPLGRSAMAPTPTPLNPPLTPTERPQLFASSSSTTTTAKPAITLDFSGMVVQVPQGVTDPIGFAKAVAGGVRDFIDLNGINMSIAEAFEQMGQTS